MRRNANKGNLMEAASRKRARKKKMQELLLHTIAGAGVLSVALMAPNALRMFELFGYGRGQKRTPAYAINRAFRSLVERRYIVLEEKKGGTFARLTPRGEQKLRLWNETENIQNTVKKKWDQKWRVVIFDIREEKKSIRERLRAVLTRIGFVRLQDSVWVFPHDCEELHILLKAELHIGKDVLYMIVDSIENDRYLKKHFGL